eukprot:COSAG01_NODE_6707_length_3533_cov_8.328289_6_plen_134_part_00
MEGGPPPPAGVGGPPPPPPGACVCVPGMRSPPLHTPFTVSIDGDGAGHALNAAAPHSIHSLKRRTPTKSRKKARAQQADAARLAAGKGTRSAEKAKRSLHRVHHPSPTKPSALSSAKTNSLEVRLPQAAAGVV